MRAQITLKSGAQIEVEVEALDSERNRLTNELTRLGWTTPAEWTRKLHSITLSEIAAIVMLREQGEWDEPDKAEPAEQGEQP